MYGKHDYEYAMDAAKEETLMVKSIIEGFEKEKKYSSTPSPSNFTPQIYSNQKAQIHELDGEIFKMQEKILKQKEYLRMRNIQEANDERRVKLLEKALQKSLGKYNENLNKNKLIKENINRLRQERKRNKEIFQEISLSISTSKEKMKKMIDLGMQTVKTRETSERKVRELEKQAEIEEKQYHSDLSDLKSIIQKEKSLKSRLNSPRIQSQIPPEPKSLDIEEDIKRKILTTSWKIASDKASVIVSLNKLEEYDEITKKFLELTGFSDTEGLLKNYEDIKEHNNVLSTYIEDLSTDIEKLETQLKQLKLTINSYSLEEKKSTVEQDRKLVRPRKTQENPKEFKWLSDKINRLFEKIGCKAEKNSVRSSMEKTTAKISGIEARCHEILEIYNDFNVNSILKPVKESMLDVEIPPFQEKDTEEDEIGPLSWQELMKKAERKAKFKKHTK